jgi:acetyl-CoA C-acetyltransferase
MIKEVVIVDAIRTGVGSFLGSLSSVSAMDLGKNVIKSLVMRSNLDTKLISEVIMGQVLTGGCGQNPARQAAVNAGIDVSVPAYTVGKVCGSGLKAVALAASSIKSGDNEIVISGGQENMSLSAHSLYLRAGAKFGDAKLVDMMLNDGLSDAFHSYSMGITAENVAKKYNISREEQDQFALNSQNKAHAASSSGRFNDEILAVTIPSKKGDIIFNKDEFIREGTSLESLAKLRPAFDKDGSVTAGNASGINDGAAACLVMSGEKASLLGLKPLARIVSYASAGIDPEIMGVGPIGAIEGALKKAGWSKNDLDLIELNEAFAAQSIAVIRSLDLDISKINVNGGAIAIGHPIGASGARVLTSLLYEMKKRGAKKGLASLCIGGGMGIAMCVESL